MCSARIAPFVLLLIVAVCPLPRAWAQPPAEAAPIIDYRQRFVPVAGRQGMVVGPEKLATEIGLQVLREGGKVEDMHYWAADGCDVGGMTATADAW